MSAVSHALTIHEPLRFEHVGERSFKVEGTPADCVNLAVVKLLPKPPDVVVSDCPLAALQIEQARGGRVHHPVEALLAAYEGTPLD